MHEDEFDDLITIARFAFPYQAHIAAGKLKSEGVFAVVFEDRALQLMPWLDTQSGGMARVRVRTSDEARAREILAQIEASFAKRDELPGAIDIQGRIYEVTDTTCPECGASSSYSYQPEAKQRADDFASIVRLDIPIKLETDHFCYACHHEWQG